MHKFDFEKQFVMLTVTRHITDRLTERLITRDTVASKNIPAALKVREMSH